MARGKRIAGKPCEKPRKEKPAKIRRKRDWSKFACLLTILAGLLIVQECLYLMYLSILNGYTATAAWLTAAVGVGEAVIIAGATNYFSLAKSDHKEGGITFEAAKANGFRQGGNADSPKI